MGKLSLFIGGLAVGLGGMFFLDPSRGRKRRALVRYHVTDWSRTASKASQRAWHRLSRQSSRAVKVARNTLREQVAAVTH